MWISINVTNPIINSSLPISIESYNEKSELIDRGALLIEISPTIGLPTAFNAYAVKREQDLEAGKRGPFHLLLLLTNNLPKTNATE